jgi:hypothetical protein
MGLANEKTGGVEKADGDNDDEIYGVSPKFKT